MTAENDQQPKCLRIVVTAFFADGSSTVIDIPEPIEVKDESGMVEPEEFTDPYFLRFSSAASYHFVLKAKANPDIPVRLMPLPVPNG